MSRYTGPRLKVMRALGCELPGLSRKSLGERNYPPGQHGQRARRKSDYGIKLMEKQKLRMNYGLTESQLRRLFEDAKRFRGPTGDKVLELLERRLDNVVFRAGFAPTGIAARQLVRHRHVLLNGKPVNIPSIRVRPGDVVTLTDKAGKIEMVQAALAEPSLARPEWLVWETEGKAIRVSRVPSPDEVPFPVEMPHVVEYYAARL
ncbi:30S ribosomal protein S4 [Zoogloea sp.]|uniref:30S ribosomal protein S4 n=1 Tax=Zoogloea sp. TaxID=49181 RepID=UPI0035ADCB97|nr:30S ribosomal protein S4 [Rhodocyclales bacterium]